MAFPLYIAGSSNTGSGNILYSVSGTGSWSQVYATPTHVPQIVWYDSKNNIVFSSNTYSSQAEIYSSTDGVSWSAASSVGTPDSPKQGICVDGTHVVISQGATNAAVIVSTDGATWNQYVVDAGGNNYTSCIGFGLTKFFVGTMYGEIYSSSDGVTWSSALYTAHAINCIAGTATEVCAFDGGGAGVGFVKSTNGTSFSLTTSLPATAINGMATDGAGNYVACGNGGLIYLSTDSGSNWISQTSGTSKDLYCVTFGNGKWFIGGNGIFSTSTNGTSWSNQTGSPVNTGSYHGVCYASGAMLTTRPNTMTPTTNHNTAATETQ